MATFWQGSVTTTNGDAFVTVQSGDDINLVQERSLLQVETQQIVEVKRAFTDSGSVPTIELSEPWAGSTGSGRNAISAPTAGNLAEASERLRLVGDQATAILDNALTLDGNLQGLDNPSEARVNLGLGDAAVATVSDAPALAPDNDTEVPRAFYVADGLRRSVEGASGGRMSVFYTAKGQPSYFVRVPAFLCEDVAPGGELGTGLHEAFKFGAEQDSEIWVGAFQAHESNGEAVCWPGVDVRRSFNYDAARSLCQASGAGFDLMTVWDWAAVMHWCMANGFEPRGNTDQGRHHDNRWETGTRQDGDTYLPGENDGIGNILAGSGPAQWRHDGTESGISDLVGNVWEWLSGMKMVDGRAFLAADNDIPTEGGYINTGFDMPNSQTWAGIDTTGASDLLKRAGILPKGVDDPIGRYHATLDGERLPIRGGARNNGGDAGLGALYLYYARSGSNSHFGFRPRFRNP